MFCSIDSKKNNTIELLKFFAAVGVVMIHYAFPGIIGKVIYGLARFGVPFFLMISGYYVYNPDGKVVISRLLKKICHILKIWIITDICYSLFFIIIDGSFKSSIFGQVATWTSGRWISFFKLQNTWLGFTWYLFGMVLCYLVTYLIAKFDLWKITAPIAVILLIVNLFIGEALPFIRGVESDWNWCSNFYLMAFPFYALGIYVRMNEDKLVLLVDDKRVVITLVVGFFLNMMERALTHANQLFLSNIIMTFVLFVFAIKNPHKFDNISGGLGTTIKYLMYMGGYSMFIYLIHPAFKEIVIRVRNASGTNDNVIAGFAGTLVVLFGTIVVTMIIAFTKEKLSKSKG